MGVCISCVSLIMSMSDVCVYMYMYMYMYVHLGVSGGVEKLAKSGR